MANYRIAWKKIPDCISLPETIDKDVTVLVSFRNEEDNLERLINCLLNQKYPTNNFEIILINDHSTDNSESIIQAFINTPIIKLYHLPKGLTGKKNAIKFGVEKAKGSLIITTDADCYMSSNWLFSMATYFDKYKPLLLTGPVLIKEQKKFIQQFQRMELLGLISSTAGAIGINKPIMCNAANMAFEKAFFLANKNILSHQYVSGDDIFLMQKAMQKGNDKIRFIKSTEALVYTEPLKSYKSYIYQHIRWLSKSFGYTNLNIIYTAVIVYTLNLNILICLILGFKNAFFALLGLLCLIVKSIFDYNNITIVANHYHQKNKYGKFPAFQFLNILFTVILPLLTQILPFKWKGRKFYALKRQTFKSL